MKTVAIALLLAACGGTSRIEEEVAPVRAEQEAETCSPALRTLDKKIQKTRAFDYAPTDGAHIAGNADFVVNAKITFELEQVWKNGCVPTSGRVKEIRFEGQASIVANAKVEGAFAGPAKMSKLVDEVTIDTDGFAPAGIRFPGTITLPIEAGLYASAAVEAGLDAHFETHARFDVTCDAEACDGKKSASFDFNPNADAHVGFNVRSHVTPWVKTGVSIAIGSAESRLGLRAALDSDFWGYYGNTCGDDEFVQAGTVDQSLLAQVDARPLASSTPQEWEVGRWHLGFWDLLPNHSTALDRPCSPYANLRSREPSAHTRR